MSNNWFGYQTYRTNRPKIPDFNWRRLLTLFSSVSLKHRKRPKNAAFWPPERGGEKLYNFGSKIGHFFRTPYTFIHYYTKYNFRAKNGLFGLKSYTFFWEQIRQSNSIQIIQNYRKYNNCIQIAKIHLILNKVYCFQCVHCLHIDIWTAFYNMHLSGCLIRSVGKNRR